jgi:hypothetical protein
MTDTTYKLTVFRSWGGDPVIATDQTREQVLTALSRRSIRGYLANKLFDTGYVETDSYTVELTGGDIPARPQYGDRCISYLMNPQTPDGHAVNNGWAYWNASDLETAQRTAREYVERNPKLSVSIHGTEQELRARGWHNLRTIHSETIRGAENTPPAAIGRWN